MHKHIFALKEVETDHREDFYQVAITQSRTYRFRCIASIVCWQVLKEKVQDALLEKCRNRSLKDLSHSQQGN